MKTLGIETSCDETAVALYDSTSGIIAETVYSQIDLHKKYGGVVPELASRDHCEKIIDVFNDGIGGRSTPPIPSLKTSIIFSQWSLEASSGTTPPYFLCKSIWL